mgnify:CR=1 FL=1
MSPEGVERTRRLVVAFDGVADINPITNPTVEVINYYKPHGYGQEVDGSADYKGKIVDEVYTKLGQLDYAAELAQMEATQADALTTADTESVALSRIERLVS